VPEVRDTPELEVLLFERAGKPGYRQGVTGAKDNLADPLALVARRKPGCADRQIRPPETSTPAAIEVTTLANAVSRRSSPPPHRPSVTVVFQRRRIVVAEAQSGRHRCLAQPETRWLGTTSRNVPVRGLKRNA
jgi:hypothetical protein